MSRAVLFLNLCLPAFSLPGLCPEAELTAKCVSVADGDTSGSEIALEEVKAFGFSVGFCRAIQAFVGEVWIADALKDGHR